MKNELINKKRSSYSSIVKMQIQATQRFHLTQVMLAHNISDTNCDEVAEKGNSHLLLVLMYPGTILLESIVGNPQNTKSQHTTTKWYHSLAYPQSTQIPIPHILAHSCSLLSYSQ